MLITTIVLNVLLVVFLIMNGSNKNIESRTEREEELLKKDK
jgi:hypothetical protein